MKQKSRKWTTIGISCGSITPANRKKCRSAKIFYKFDSLARRHNKQRSTSRATPGQRPKGTQSIDPTKSPHKFASFNIRQHPGSLDQLHNPFAIAKGERPTNPFLSVDANGYETPFITFIDLAKTKNVTDAQLKEREIVQGECINGSISYLSHAGVSDICDLDILAVLPQVESQNTNINSSDSGCSVTEDEKTKSRRNRPPTNSSETEETGLSNKEANEENYNVIENTTHSDCGVAQKSIISMPAELSVTPNNFNESKVKFNALNGNFSRTLAEQLKLNLYGDYSVLMQKYLEYVSDIRRRQ